MTEKKVHILSNLFTILTIVFISIVIVLVSAIDINRRIEYIYILIILAVILRAHHIRSIFYFYFSHKLRTKIINDLSIIFNEKSGEILAEKFTILGSRDEKYLFGIHKINLHLTIEYLVIIEKGDFSQEQSILPYDYDENTQNLIAHSTSGIKFVAEHTYQIISNKNRWNYIINEEDIEKILERINIDE